MGNGGAGGVGTFSSLGNSSANGDTTLTANLTGGAGGLGNIGGAGGSESFSQGSFPGTIFFPNHGNVTVNLNLAGGNGGAGINGGGGAGGSADAELDYLSGTTQSISLTNLSNATGGNGGDTQSGNGGVGGSATAYQFLIGGNNISANANALAGAGGNVISGTGNGGVGSDSDSEASASSSTQNATANSNANGGAGGSANGSGGNGGNGGRALGEAIASGVNASSDLALYGGNGGNATGAGFTAGSGGSALVFSDRATGTGSGTGSVSLIVIGGNGGFGANGASGGNGASVSLDTLAVGTTSSGALNIIQSATGGYSGGTDTGPTGGIAGSATSTYTANFATPKSVWVAIQAVGGSGDTGDGASATAALNIFATNSINATVYANAIVDPETQDPDPIGSEGGSAIVNGANAGNGAMGTGTLVAVSSSANVGSSSVIATLGVYGGNGGFVPPTLASGNGGSGAVGIGSINASNAGPDDVNASISIGGGSGGAGRGVGFSGGNGATANVQNSFAGSQGGAKVSLNILASGGGGGDGQVGANGGNGASVTLSNIASGSTAGEWDLSQTAFGGRAGGSEGGVAGMAGDATSSSTLMETSGGGFFVGTQAIAGAGGNNQGAAPTAGGNAVATTNLTAVSNIVGAATAGAIFEGSSAASGGDVTGGTPALSGGRGGNTTATVNLTNNSTTGGSSLANANAFSYAGNGGNADVGNGGNGGNATATATATTAGPDTAFAEASAIAGAGGISASNGVNGTGGTAIANASAFGQMDAEALGGAGGSFGSANALAKITPGTTFAFLQSSSTVPADNGPAGVANAKVNVGTGYVVTTDQTGALLIPSPSAADVDAAWSNSYGANARAAFNNGDATKVIAVGDASLQKAAGSTTASSTVSTKQEMNINSGSLVARDLAIGMTNASTTGDALESGDSLRFVVTRNGATVVDRTMTSMTDELLFLSNGVFDLGPEINAETPGNLDLQVSCTMTNVHTGTGVSIPMVVGSIAPSTRLWVGDLGGVWGYTNLWEGGIQPDGPGTGAVFDGPEDQDVILNSPTTVGSLTINSGNKYLFSATGTGGFIFDNDGAAAQVIAMGTDHTISAPIAVTGGGLNFVVQDTRTLTVSGNISGAGSIACTSFGNVILSGLNSYTGSTTVTRGKLTIGRSLTTTSSVNVQTGARAELGSGGGNLLKAGAISITGTGVLDLNDNAMVIDYNPTADPIGNVMTYLHSAFNGGNWQGNGLTSTFAANAASQIHKMALGYAEASSLSAIPALFGTVDNSAVLVRYTFDGDANLDGSVNIADFNALALHFGGSGQFWNAGDFNYDGVVNLLDLNALATNFGQPPISAPAALGSLVPEPVCAMPIVAGAVLMRRRRRV
jgi:hypothetical protein